MSKQKHYLQDMVSPPRGTFHTARWHNNGKLWISAVEYSNVKSDVDLMVWEHNELREAKGWPHSTRYFVWHADMSQDEIDAYKAESPANKIK